MRIDLGKNMVFLPLLVVAIGMYDKAGKPNAVNASWVTVHDFGQVFVSLSPHKTKNNIKETKTFTIAFSNKTTAKIADYLGIVSGSREDKIAKANIHVTKAKHVNTPIFEEFPLVLECRLKSLTDGNLLVKSSMLMLTKHIVLETKY